jgi:hypothetical protein
MKFPILPRASRRLTFVFGFSIAAILSTELIVSISLRTSCALCKFMAFALYGKFLLL